MQEVAHLNIFGVILQEDCPGLRSGLVRANASDVSLDGVFGDGQTEFEQFATNAFRAPEPILPCHLLDQRDGFRVEFRTHTAITRFEFPEQAETLTMPVEEGVGFKDEKRFFPGLDATGKEDELEASGLRNGGLFDLAVKNRELLAERCIFSDDIGFAACQVGDRAENYRKAGGLGEIEKDMFKESAQSDDELDGWVKEDEHIA